MVKIAVCSKDYQQVTGHAGQAKNWLLFEIPEQGPWQVQQIALSKAQTFHHYQGDASHPLDGISTLIAISSGESFLARMRNAGVDAVLTAETNPEKAVQDYLEHQLSPPKPRPIGQLFCRLRDAFSDN